MHAYPLDAGSELASNGKPESVAVQGIVTDGIVSNRDDCLREVVGLADADRGAVRIGATPFECGVSGAEEWEVDDAEDGLVALDESEGGTAEGDAVDEVGGAVDGVECPHQFPVATCGSFFFAEEGDLGCGVAEKVAELVLDGEVDFGSHVAVAFGRQLGRPMGAEQV